MQNDQSDGSNYPKGRNSRPTIGLLTRPLGDKLYALRWLGVADAAKERGANYEGQPAVSGKYRKK